MKQLRLMKGLWYRKRYIPAADYGIEHFGNGETYLTALVYDNVPVSVKLTKGLEKRLKEIGVL